MNTTHIDGSTGSSNPLGNGTYALGYVRENARRVARTAGTVEKRSSCQLRVA